MNHGNIHYLPLTIARQHSRCAITGQTARQSFLEILPFPVNMFYYYFSDFTISSSDSPHLSLTPLTFF